MAKPEIALEVNTQSLDVAIEKANQLVELLQEASQLISSLCVGDCWSKSLAQKINEEFKNGNNEATLYCVAQHLKAYHDQCCVNELADWDRPCSQCDQFIQCDVNHGVNMVSEFCSKQGVHMTFNRTPV